MPRCSELALETALQALSEHAESSRARANWMSTFLVAQRMTAAGYPMSTNGANQGVDDVFVLLPDHPRGRSNPFVSTESDYRWGQVEASGRKTVWNTGTRSGAQTALFKGNHFQNGLRPDAVQQLLHHLGTDEPLPARDALAVFLTRNHDWAQEPSRQDLRDEAAVFLGLSSAEFEAITEDSRLAVPVLGDPVWSVTLLAQSNYGPPTAKQHAGTQPAPADEIAIESVRELPDQFRRYLNRHGVAAGGEEEILDLLASTLSSQLVIMAGPSGTGKSLTAAALAAFFAPVDRRCKLEGGRLLAKPQEFFGYYSHLADNSFVAYDPLLKLLQILEADEKTPPMITVEEANLSPMEGYLAPLVHGFGEREVEQLLIPLHTQGEEVASQLEGRPVPSTLELGPYPRFFATINVDADSAAPARKVVSRACVVLLETPEFDTALAAAGTLASPPVEQGTGQAAEFIGRPTIAFDRYIASGSNTFEQAMSDRAAILRAKLGADAIAHRQLQKSLMYMAWYLELAGVSSNGEGETTVEVDPDREQAIIDAAADNALLHFVLPSLAAAQFDKALAALNDGNRSGVLRRRLSRLQGIVSEHQFGPPPDFWGALS